MVTLDKNNNATFQNFSLLKKNSEITQKLESNSALLKNGNLF